MALGNLGAKQRPATSLSFIASMCLGLLPLLATFGGCISAPLPSGLATASLPQVTYPGPTLPVHAYVAPFTFEDAGIPSQLGPLLHTVFVRMLADSKLFASVVTASDAPVSADLRAISLYPSIAAFTIETNYTWLSVYLAILLVPMVGTSLVALAVFAAGLPYASQVADMTLKLRVVDSTTEAELDHHLVRFDKSRSYSAYSYREFPTGFSRKPQQVLLAVCRRAVLELIWHRFLYDGHRNAAADAQGSAPPPTFVTPAS